MAFKFRDYLHSIFFILFIAVNLTIFFYLQFKIKNECDCANEKVFGLVKPLDYILWFSLAAAGLGIINIVVNLNQGLSSIPIIGSVFNFAIAIACLIQVFMLSNFLTKTSNQQCKELKKCDDGNLKLVGGILVGAGYFIYLGAFILAIILVWI
jgi:hypothetical protein